MGTNQGPVADQCPSKKLIINTCRDGELFEVAEKEFQMKLDSKEALIQELLNKVNTLTLDKNRLRQRLTQKNQQQQNSATNYSSGFRNINGGNNQVRNHAINSNSHSSTSLGSNEHTPESASSVYQTDSHQSPTSSLSDINNLVIDGIDCATSCEEDLISLVSLYRKRLLECQDITEYVTSKCLAFQLELNSLQKHYGYGQQEIADLRGQLEKKSEEYDDLKGELQTVVLNYESQLSTMSEHVSFLTDKVASQSDEIERLKLISKTK